MLNKKCLSIGIPILLSVVITLSILLGVVYKSNYSQPIIRDIEIGQINYQKSVENVLNMFDASKNEMNGIKATFEGTLNFNAETYELNYLASGIDGVTVKYITNYDLEKNIFIVDTISYADDVIVEKVTNEYIPMYDDAQDDVYILVEDTPVSIREILGEEKQDCFAFAIPWLAGAIALLFVATTAPVVLNPSFYEPVSNTISNTATSIWDWLRNLFAGPQVQTVAKNEILTASELAQAQQGPSLNKVYQIAYVASSGVLQISAVYLNWFEALALLHSVKPLNAMLNSVNGLRNKINSVNVGSLGQQASVDAQKLKNESKVGIYTNTRQDAASLAWAVGARADSAGNFKSEIHNQNVGSKYLYHFHDGAHTIHIWYGNAI